MPKAVLRTGVLLSFLAITPVAVIAQDLDLATNGADVRWRGVTAGAVAGTYLDQGTMNNDGRKDLIIGAPGSAGDPGHVYIVFAGPVPSAGEHALSTASVVITGVAAGDGFGTSVAAGNILNLDGTDPRNLIVGAPNAAGGSGIVYVFNAPLGSNAATQNLSATTASVVVHGAPGDRLGSAIATADLDADGFREIIIGAPGTNHVYIIWGGAALAGQTRDMARVDAIGPDVTITGTGIGGVLTAGPFTGDNIYDLFIGAPSVDLVYMIQGLGTRGYPRNMFVQRDETAYLVAFPGQQAGSSFRMGDFDGDGRTDILIGAPGTGPSARGAAYIMWGKQPTDPPLTSMGLAAADVTLNGPAPGAHFGQVVTGGDINRDTGEDVAILAPGASSGGTIYVHYGRRRSTYGVLQASGARVVDTSDPAQVSLRIIGDPAVGGIRTTAVYEVTGEGARDLIVGSPRATTAGGSTSGRIYFVISPKMSLSDNDVAATAVQGRVGHQSIQVLNQSPTSITFNAQSGMSWLTVAPASGTAVAGAPGNVGLTVAGTGLAPGDYVAPFTVRSTSPHLTMTLAAKVRMTVITQPTVGANKTFPVSVLTPVTWTAHSTGGAAGLLYKFWRFDAASGWHLTQDWSTTNTYTWTPTMTDVGSHSIQVWVRTPESTATSDASVDSATFSVIRPVPVITSFTNTGVYPLAPNTPVLFNARATGGIPPIQYRFYLFREGTGWSILQDYSDANQVTWTPAAAGNYAMQVWVRSSGVSDSLEAARDSGRLSVSTTAPVAVPGLTADRPFPAKAGQTIAFIATATGGSTGPLQYQFWRFDAGRGWTIGQAFSASRTYSWTPGAGDIGDHAVQVWVRSAASSAAFEGVRDSGMFKVVADPLSAPSLKANVVFPSPPNRAVIWTVTASGGVAPLQYQFWVFRDGAGWTMARDYATSNTFTWTPTVNGTYALQAWVRSTGSRAAFDAVASSGFFAIRVAPITPVLATNAAFPVPPNQTVTWTVTAGGGIPPLQYQFWVFRQGAGWTMARDYATSNTLAWTPGVSGTYSLQAWVRSTGSTAPYDAVASTGLFNIQAGSPAQIARFIANRALPAPVGTTITWTATGTRGTAGPLQYRFWRFSRLTGVWTIVQDYSAANTWSWRTSSTDNGQYELQVWVRSAGSTAAFEGFASSGLITVK